MNKREDFLEALKAKGYSKGTIRYKKLYIGFFFEWLKKEGIETYDDVTQSILEKYQKHLLKKINRQSKAKLSLRTILQHLIVLKQYFEYLREHKHILINPSINIALPKPSEVLPKNILQEQEINSLLEKPNLKTPTGLRDKAILELMYSTAIRRQETVNLNIYDINLNEGTVRVNKGKNRKDRIVPIGKTACRSIKKYLNKVRNIYVKRNKNRDAAAIEQPLFLTEHGNKLKPATLNYIVKKYAGTISLRRKISCHSLRHTCATHLLRAGANLRLIQQMLGHNSITTTQIYTRVSPMDLKAAHKKYHPSNRRGGLNKKLSK